MTLAQGVNLLELRTTLGLRPMAEFDPYKPARLYDANGSCFDWDPRMAGHYLRWAGPYKDKDREPVTDYDGLELLGWQPV